MEIKCPYCCSQDWYWEHSEADWNDLTFYWFANCNDCGCEFDIIVSGTIETIHVEKCHED